ncbi:unnamed protein product [Chrysodeixis includens]|uniref:Uncharacterized protein n=1 Tax=Chrysodeixis includens TaxID=689277 RepID=A0A9N8KSC2_CHRIL|nr:unnamed protein product [Chrysodeixis includens]
MEQRLRGVGNGIMAQKHWCGYQRSALVGRVSAARAALYVITSLINRSVSIIINGQRALKTKVFVSFAHRAARRRARRFELWPPRYSLVHLFRSHTAPPAAAAHRATQPAPLAAPQIAPPLAVAYFPDVPCGSHKRTRSPLTQRSLEPGAWPVARRLPAAARRGHRASGESLAAVAT